MAGGGRRDTKYPFNKHKTGPYDGVKQAYNVVYLGHKTWCIWGIKRGVFGAYNVVCLGHIMWYVLKEGH